MAKMPYDTAAAAHASLIIRCTDSDNTEDSSYRELQLPPFVNEFFKDVYRPLMGAHKLAHSSSSPGLLHAQQLFMTLPCR